MYKYILSIGILGLALGCNPDSATKQAPSDLPSLRAYKADLQAQIGDLQGELDSIEKEINKLAPASLKKAALVTVEKVTSTTFSHFVNMPATVQSDEVVKLGSETGGRILKLYCEEGQNISKGQLIAKLDLGSLNKQLAELETSYDLSVDIYERQKRLWDQKIGTEVQYLQAKNNMERIEKSMESVKHQLSKANIYAPISGVVERIFQKEGEVVSPGFPIVEIINTQKVKIVADLPENYLQAVRKGEMVDIYFPALRDSIFGHVSLVGRTIDASNRTFKVEVNVQNKTGLLKPNLLAEMRINDFTKEDVIVISADLVQQEINGQKFIFTMDTSAVPAVAKKVYIKTGEGGNNQVVITSGLSEGTQLIVKGALGLTTGDPIEVVDNRTENDD
jgi:RND family efflux transporter MFP subunit